MSLGYTLASLLLAAAARWLADRALSDSASELVRHIMEWWIMMR
ncbi:protein of unknown function (plasmid) [Rhodovastum atsumiense]|nr:protein of unknown function [Rhodovastum atsumiense]